MESDHQARSATSGLSPDRQADLMDTALAMAASLRGSTSPNPTVGCAVLGASGAVHTGVTEPPPGRHAEKVALAEAGDDARGATLATTLEPCNHHGRTPPCTDAIVAAGISHVVVALTDPDPLVTGTGIERLRSEGIEVTVGVRSAEAEQQLAPYLTHRRTGRPYVVLKLAASLDGGTAAPDATSQWITGADARADAHLLRAESDAILVGAGTVRDDDPSLTVRDLPDGHYLADKEPLRVVLGQAAEGARIHPCVELSGELAGVLDELGERGVIQLMVEGGAGVAGEFHRQGLVDRYVLYLAPALFGGEDHRGLLAGPGAQTIDDLWRGDIADVTKLGTDLRIDLIPGGTACSRA